METLVGLIRDWGRKESAVIKTASFWVLIIFISFGLWAVNWWHYGGVIDAKNATIEGLTKDNDRLNNQVRAQKNAPDVNALTVRQRITYFQQDFERDNAEWMRTHGVHIPDEQIPELWSSKYASRCASIRDQLSALGQRSNTLDDSIIAPKTSADVDAIIEELFRLAGHVPY